MTELVRTPNGTFVERSVVEAAGLDVPKPKRASSTRKSTTSKSSKAKPARKAAGASRRGKA